MNHFLETIRPEFFDIFGIFVFTFIIIVSICGLKTGRSFEKWVLITLLTMGILGLSVDVVIVYITYLT